MNPVQRRATAPHVRAAPKGKPKTRARIRPKIAKKIFRYETDQSYVRMVRIGKKHYVFRGGKQRWNEQDTIRRFIVHAVLHKFYPRNTIEPVGLTYVQIEIVKKPQRVFGFLSKTVKARSQKFKTSNDIFYRESESLDWREKAMDREHRLFVLKQAGPVADKISSRTGIAMNVKRMNVAESRGEPVFFEPAWVDIAQFQEFLKAEKLTETAVYNLLPRIPSGKRQAVRNEIHSFFRSQRDLDFQ